MNQNSNEQDAVEHGQSEATDARLDALLEDLLDEALASTAVAGGVPEGLVEGVIGMTADRLPSVAGTSSLNDQTDSQPTVLATIGSSRVLVLRRIAAVILLFAWIGAAFVVVSIVNDARTNIDKNRNLATVQDVIQHVGQATPEVVVVAEEVDPIDTALDQLEVDIELAVSSTTTSWEELAAEFEAELEAFDAQLEPMELTEPGA